MKKQAFKEGEIMRFNSLIHSFENKVTDFFESLLAVDLTSLQNEIIVPSENPEFEFNL